MPSPSPISPISLSSALTSALRVWLTYRDQALWVMCQGTDPDTHPLALPIDSQLAQPFERMEVARQLADDLARQINPEAKPESVIRAHLRDLLAIESPKFLLRVDGIPDAF